jgi:plasmid stabilization system protein ParE
LTELPFLPAAEAEFLQAVDHYEGELPGLGADLILEIEAASRRIVSFPQHGRPYLAGTRRVLLRGFPFSLVYLSDPGESVVVAVAHHRRRPGYWLDRVPRRPA